VKPQVSQHFAEYCQVMETGVTEPGLQADSLDKSKKSATGAWSSSTVAPEDGSGETE
jgi:hypothetical protein